MSELDEALHTLRSSVIECRPENVRFRQDQLLAFHTALRENVDKIYSGIIEDSGCSVAEAELEFWLGIDCIRKSYENLDFAQTKKQEYSVKFGKDNVDRRVGLGLVGVKPQVHSRFYSIVSPISAAIEAGNCILLELVGASKNLDSILRDVLTRAMDPDTFFVSSTSIKATQVDVLVDQTSESVEPGTKTLSSFIQSRSIAVVDRTADVKTAAKAITKARMSVASSSCYSPDLILVNEFIAEAFVMACLEFAREESQSASRKSFEGAIDSDFKAQLRVAESDGKAKLYHSESKNITIVELNDRSSSLAKMKVKGPYIIILPCTSITDSVTSQRSSATFISSYLFASASVCKFLAEQVSSQASYINQIPAQLLIGPSSPSSFQHTIHPRYSSQLFSVARPQFTTPPKGFPQPEADLKKLATAALPPTGQPLGRAIGFFEQGILIGLGTTVFVILPLAGYVSYLAVRQGRDLFKAIR